jgi:hypothetical protein
VRLQEVYLRGLSSVLTGAAACNLVRKSCFTRDMSSFPSLPACSLALTALAKVLEQRAKISKKGNELSQLYTQITNVKS